MLGASGSLWSVAAQARRQSDLGSRRARRRQTVARSSSARPGSVGQSSHRLPLQDSASARALLGIEGNRATRLARVPVSQTGMGDSSRRNNLGTGSVARTTRRATGTRGQRGTLNCRGVIPMPESDQCDTLARLARAGGRRCGHVRIHRPCDGRRRRPRTRDQLSGVSQPTSATGSKGCLSTELIAILSRGSSPPT